MDHQFAAFATRRIACAALSGFNSVAADYCTEAIKKSICYGNTRIDDCDYRCPYVPEQHTILGLVRYSKLQKANSALEFLWRLPEMD
jgi:hypothetical protein